MVYYSTVFAFKTEIMKKLDIDWFLRCSVPVKLFCPHPPGIPPGQPRGLGKNMCDKKGGSQENKVEKGGEPENEGIKVIK